MESLKELLEKQYLLQNTIQFVKDDPISIPKLFSKLQDIEIISFWVSTLAWGNRRSIINSGLKLVDLMEGKPYEFILNHKEVDRERFLTFKHRTFQPRDALWFLEYLQQYYHENESLEDAFSRHVGIHDMDLSNGFVGFYNDMFGSSLAPDRTKKHVATPAKGSSCKRLNMFMRWMVRKDDHGVDFGLWKTLRPDQLLIPLDVHVHRVALKLGLMKRRQRDWRAVLELTENLRNYDSNDPTKYDFALFGMGVNESLEGFAN